MIIANTFDFDDTFADFFVEMFNFNKFSSVYRLIYFNINGSHNVND